MTRTDHVHLAIVLAAALGCQAPAPSGPPRPNAVEPAQGYERVATSVEIVGSDFHVRGVQQSGAPDSSVDAGYRAWVGGVELEEVVWLDSTRLRARVPAGLAVGRHDVTVEGPFGGGSAASAFEVLAGWPPALSAALTSPRAVSVGQEVVIGVTVENGGASTVEAVRPDVVVTGAGALALVGAADPQDLAPGTARTFASRFRAEQAGDVSIAVSVLGTDSRTGATMTASAAGHLLIEPPAALSASLAIPQGPIAGGEFPVTLTVTNTGGATAVGVLPGALVDEGSTGTFTVVSAPSQPVALGSAEAFVFTWTCRAVASGTLRLGASVSGFDANDGAVRTAAGGAIASVPDTATVIAEDPFFDGSRFAFVAPYRGQVYVGPSGTGTGVLRVLPDGTAPESLALLSFPRDTVGNVSSSTGPWPHKSIGFTGCATGAQCGPNGESGRGLLTSVTFAGDEWLVLGGAKSGSGDLDYVYLSRASASPLDFSYVDVSDIHQASTKGFSAAHVAGGRLYLGFPDSGGERPFGVALLTAPTEPGLNAVKGTHTLDLGLHDAYVTAYKDTFSNTNIALVDAIADLGGRVYFFDDVGCLVSTSSSPTTKADFRGCSPAASAYVRDEAVAPTRQYDLEPRDKAWPRALAWNGRLYAIRNTTTGPQLWSCDPAGGADPVACDPDDWTLLAADAANRTKLGSDTVASASMLLATATHLYLGLDDDTRGLRVFRTRVALPGVSDFTGRDGCAAGTPGCQGLGGDGLGAPAFLTRILDAKVVTAADGRVDLFLTAGNGSSPFRVIRMDP
jgi:hypothetical protein